MKKIILLFAILLVSNLSQAQTEKYTLVLEQFISHYNKGNYDAIFQCFSPEMKQTLPLKSTKQFLAGLKTEAGQIKSQTFSQFEGETYAVYKTTFEKSVFAIQLSLDENNLINGIAIKPYEDPQHSAHPTVNALQSYPSNIANLLFSKTKDFPTNTQLAVALIQNGQTHYYGLIKTNDTLKPIENRNFVFEIGSITKVFTATLLAQFVEDGTLKLTDDINSHYSFPFHQHRKLSFESLANHTSGLPRLPGNLDLSDQSNPYKAYGKKQIEAYLKKDLVLHNTTPKMYAYSNLGTGLLGYTLGLTQKTSVQELFQTNLFDPYNMHNTYTANQKVRTKLVQGQNPNGEIIPNWDFDVLFAAGGILSTTEDLAQFAIAQFNPNNKALARTRKPTFEINATTKIGLGWHIITTNNGKEAVWHNGGTGGYSSSMTLDIVDQTAVIILSNVSSMHSKMKNIDELCFELLEEIQAKEQ